MEDLKSLEDLQRINRINAINTLRSEFNKLLLSHQLQPLPKDVELSWEEYGKRIYVPTRAKTAFEQNEFLLTDEMDRFLKDPVKRIAVVLGDPGSGKTTFAKRWLAECFQAYEKTKKTFLPLFIELQQVLNKNYPTPNKLLEEYFDRVGLSSPEITAIRSIPLLVLCDGYDEVSYEGHLYQDNRWSEWPQVKFIITTRREKFGLGLNVSELRDILSTTFSPKEGDTTGLVLYQLHDFNENDVRLFVQQWQALANSDWDEVTYLEKLKQIPGLTELTTNPIILSLVLFTLPDLVKQYAVAKTSSVALHSSSSLASSSAASSSTTVEQKHFERIKIYDFFVNKWFNHQAHKVWKKLDEMNVGLKKRLWKLTLTDALYEYTTQLGRWCLRYSIDGKLQIEIPAEETLKAYLLPEKYQSLNLTLEEITQLLIALRSGCLLRCDDEYFNFFHKTLVEYFVQAHIVKGMVGQLLLEDKCEELNIKIAEPKLLEDLAKRAKEEKMFSDCLYKVLRKSKEISDIGLAAANAITILSKAKQPLNRESWQGIHIPGADLSYANLHGADLRDADLSGVNFSHAYLEEANLSGSQLRGCEWGAPPSINFGSSVKAVVYPWGRPWILVGEEEGEIHLVDLKSGAIEQTLPHYNAIYWRSWDELVSLAVDGDATYASQWIASAAVDGDIYLWSLSSEKAVYQKKVVHKQVTCIALSGDGQCLASSSRDKTIRIWNVATGQMLAQLMRLSSSVSSIALSMDGKYVALGEDKTVCVCEVDSGQELVSWMETAGVNSVRFSMDGMHLVSGSADGTVRVREVVSGRELVKLVGHAKSVTSVMFSADGKHVVSGSADRTVRVWDVVTQQAIAILQGHSNDVISVSISADGQRAVSGSNDRTVRVWNIPLQPELAIFQEYTGKITRVAFSVDSQRVVFESNDGTIRVWDVIRGRELLKLDEHAWKVTSLAFSRDGQRVVLVDSNKNNIHIWDVATGWWKSAQLGKSQKHKRNQFAVDNVAISNDGERMVAITIDGTIRVWDAMTGQKLAKLKEVCRYERVDKIVFSENTERMVSFGRGGFFNVDKIIRVWDMKRELVRLQGEVRAIKDVAFSRDGQKLVTSDYNHMRVWDVMTGRELIKLEGHNSNITMVAFADDDRQVVSGSKDYTVRIWNLVSKTCVQTIHVNFFVTKILFEKTQLKIGGYQNHFVQWLVYQRNNQSLYYLYDYWDNGSEFVNSHPYALMNIESTTGLTSKQQTLVLNQGAIGKPAALSHFDAMTEKQEDAVNLSQLKSIKKSLKNHSSNRTQIPSIFNSSATISYSLWIIYLYRVTLPKNNTSSSSSSSGSSFSNRHVYGIAEGLDQRNRRLLIRFDLVEDSNQKGFGLVKIKIIEVDAQDKVEGKKGFIALCHNDKNPDPQEIVCFSAGTLKLTQLDNLFSRIIDEMQRQFQYDESQRIRYRFRGGDDQAGESHNCLTWLRYLFKDFEALKIPRGTLDFFAANPADILPSSSGFFSGALPAGVEVLKTSDWSNPEPVAAPSNSGR